MAAELSTPTTADQMRREIERTRAEIQASLEVLRVDVVERLDLRRAYRQRPGTWLAGAFMVGLVVGLSSRR
ncbi:MAG TPA: hypothetical protein VK013_11675 [Myxococcaceae bacterium]|nr:hypothetical protein [Myxococcaceae bacterium]